MTYRLVRPTAALEQEYLDYISEWLRVGETLIPYAARFEEADFSHLLARWERDETEAAVMTGFVPASLYFMINDADRILGAIHIRHRLNDALLRHGGHIGYGVRPSDRNRGVAARMLSMGLKIAAELGIMRVLVTCSRDNIGSARTILANGGVLENEISEGDIIVQRYWIDTIT